MTIILGETPHIEWKFLDYKRKLLELWWDLEAEIPVENFLKCQEYYLKRLNIYAL